MKETVLLFNISQSKYSKIMRAALPLKLRVKRVSRTEYYKTIGELAGISAKSDTPVYEDNGISEEMMVLCGFSNSLIDRLFFALKKTGAGSVKLTAVLTETNKDWNVITLCEELKREREQMTELRNRQ